MSLFCFPYFPVKGSLRPKVETNLEFCLSCHMKTTLTPRTQISMTHLHSMSTTQWCKGEEWMQPWCWIGNKWVCADHHDGSAKSMLLVQYPEYHGPHSFLAWGDFLCWKTLSSWNKAFSPLSSLPGSYSKTQEVSSSTPCLLTPVDRFTPHTWCC